MIGDGHHISVHFSIIEDKIYVLGVLHEIECYFAAGVCICAGRGFIRLYIGDYKSLEVSDATPPTPEKIEADLVHTNVVFKTTIGSRNVSFTKLRQFIKEYCVDSLGFKYEWYGLYLFAYSHQLLQDTNLQNFSSQMNKPEWFGYLDDRKHSTADSMGDYNFLLDYPQSRWDASAIPSASKATRSGLNKVVRMYNSLAEEFRDDRVCG